MVNSEQAGTRHAIASPDRHGGQWDASLNEGREVFGHVRVGDVRPTCGQWTGRHEHRYRAFGGGRNAIGIDGPGDWIIDGVQRFAGCGRRSVPEVLRLERQRLHASRFSASCRPIFFQSKVTSLYHRRDIVLILGIERVVAEAA